MFLRLLMGGIIKIDQICTCDGIHSSILTVQFLLMLLLKFLPILFQSATFFSLFKIQSTTIFSLFFSSFLNPPLFWGCLQFQDWRSFYPPIPWTSSGSVWISCSFSFSKEGKWIWIQERERVEEVEEIWQLKKLIEEDSGSEMEERESRRGARFLLPLHASMVLW